MLGDVDQHKKQHSAVVDSKKNCRACRSLGWLAGHMEDSHSHGYGQATGRRDSFCDSQAAKSKILSENEQDWGADPRIHSCYIISSCLTTRGLWNWWPQSEVRRMVKFKWIRWNSNATTLSTINITVNSGEKPWGSELRGRRKWSKGGQLWKSILDWAATAWAALKSKKLTPENNRNGDCLPLSFMEV